MASKRDLSAQEYMFLEYLFDGDTVRHPKEAKKLAGYDDAYPLGKVLDNVSEELIKRCDKYLTAYGPKAIAGLLSIINDPTEPGAKIKLQAITDLLDRAGIVKKEKTETQQAAQNFLFVLPSKEL